MWNFIRPRKINEKCNILAIIYTARITKFWENSILDANTKMQNSEFLICHHWTRLRFWPIQASSVVFDTYSLREDMLPTLNANKWTMTNSEPCAANYQKEESSKNRPF